MRLSQKVIAVIELEVSTARVVTTIAIQLNCIPYAFTVSTAVLSVICGGATARGISTGFGFFSHWFLLILLVNFEALRLTSTRSYAPTSEA